MEGQGLLERLLRAAGEVGALCVALNTWVQSRSQRHRDAARPPSVLGPRTLNTHHLPRGTFWGDLPSTPLTSRTDFLQQTHCFGTQGPKSCQSNTVGHSGPESEKTACLSFVCHSLGGLAAGFPFSGSRSYNSNHCISFFSLADISCWSIDYTKQGSIHFGGLYE